MSRLLTLALMSVVPSWSGLPAQRRWQIVTYLKALR